MATGDPFVGNVRNVAPMGYEVIRIADFGEYAPSGTGSLRRTCTIPFDCEGVAVIVSSDTDNTAGAGTALTLKLFNNSLTLVPIVATLDLEADYSTTPLVSRVTLLTSRAFDKGEYICALLEATGAHTLVHCTVDIVVQAKAETDNTVAQSL